jgi:hypothetical protein
LEFDRPLGCLTGGSLPRFDLSDDCVRAVGETGDEREEKVKQEMETRKKNRRKKENKKGGHPPNPLAIAAASTTPPSSHFPTHSFTEKNQEKRRETAMEMERGKSFLLLL